MRFNSYKILNNRQSGVLHRGAPMGRPKLELLASNGVHICHAI